MNDKIVIFNNEEFGEIRIATVDGEPMFCLVDVCKALNLTQPSKVKERLKKDGVNTIPTIDSLGRTQNALFINESNLYKTIFQSRKENAEKFADWVTGEILPTIRRTGGYINNSDLMVNTYFSYLPDDGKTLVKGLLTNIEELQKEKSRLIGKNICLDKENDLLAQKNLQWADRPLICALVRAYATSIGNFGKAWNDFKKEILYKYGINLNSRITNYLNSTGKKTKPKTLSMLDDSELPKAISVAVSMCRENNVDIDYLLKKAN